MLVFMVKNECSSNPCRNNAHCIDKVNGFNCTCMPGYNGVLCENQINECDSNPCLNGGTCTDRLAAFTCTCPLGFSGVR